MAQAVPLKAQYLTDVSPDGVQQLRTNASELAAFLKRKPGQGLGQYWHAVAYLLDGRPKNMDEPYAWFVEGGETMGVTDAGPVRYLAPNQVASLAAAVEDEEPDELGMGNYDEAAMDRKEIYPARWRVYAETFDPLGQMREMYTYVRAFLMEARTRGHGAIVYFAHEGELPEESGPTPATTEPEPSKLVARSLVAGGKGRAYFETDAAKDIGIAPDVLKKVDADAATIGYSHVGDILAPIYGAGGGLRAYLAKDRTAAAIAFLSVARGFGSWTFLSLLEGDALVGASDAFMQTVKKTKLFGLSMSRSGPAELQASVLQRREELRARFGAPRILEGDLKSIAEIWESYASRT